MKKQLIYILLLVFSFSGFAQKSIDLRKNSSLNTQAQTKIDSAIMLRQHDPAIAFDLALQGLEFAMQSGNTEIEADCYKVIGDINTDVQQYDLAIDNYQKALAIYEQGNFKEKEQEVLVLLADAFSANEQLDLSEQYFQQSAQRAKSTNSKQQLRSSKKGLAGVYKKRGEQEKAIQELEEVRKMDIEEEMPQEQYKTNRSLIEAYSASQPARALALTEENQEIALTQSDTSAYVTTLKDKAGVYGTMGNTSAQLSTLQQSAQVREEQQDFEGLSQDKLEISEVLLDQEQVDDAITYLEESIELADRTGKTSTKQKALKSLSSAYDRTGDYSSAYRIYKEYVSVSEQAANEREQKILESLSLMQNLTSRLQRMDMLENQQLLNDRTIEVLQQEQQVAKKSLQLQRNIILAMLIVFTLLLVVIIMVVKSARQKRIANQLLALRSLRSQMNPHFIFNALNSVNSFISQSDERSANKYLSDFSRLMRAVMENSKFDYVSLQSEIEILQLYLKLEHHRFESKFDYEFNVDPKLDAESIQVPPMLIQPYIENAIWHGLRYKEEKGYLKIQFIMNQALEVVIEDNGIGRKQSQELKTKHQKQGNSTGIKNIKSRIDLINQLNGPQIQVSISDLDPKTETGTCVHLKWISN